MRALWTLTRREIGSHFLSFSGYAFVATVLLLLGFSLVDMLDKVVGLANDIPLHQLFFVTLYFWIVLLLTTPVITMRAFALERFSGTFETLTTTPARDSQIVLAKYLGSMFVFLVAWMPLLGAMVWLQGFSKTPDAGVSWPMMGSNALGVVLIGSAYVAMGCYASSLSRSQLIASILSYALGLGLFLLGFRSLAPIPATGWAAGFFEHISMTIHLEDFAGGRAHLSAMVFYASLTALFLFLCWRNLGWRRWQ